MALTIYEENPSAAHEPEGQISDVLLYIDAVLTFEGLGKNAAQVFDLESRAETLQQPLQ